MNITERVLALFSAGLSVQRIALTVGMKPEAVRETLTRRGERPRGTASITYTARVCPFYDSCRDCTFQACVLDMVRAVTV